RDRKPAEVLRLANRPDQHDDLAPDANARESCLEALRELGLPHAGKPGHVHRDARLQADRNQLNEMSEFHVRADVCRCAASLAPCCGRMAAGQSRRSKPLRYVPIVTFRQLATSEPQRRGRKERREPWRAARRRFAAVAGSRTIRNTTHCSFWRSSSTSAINPLRLHPSAL